MKKIDIWSKKLEGRFFLGYIGIKMIVLRN